MARSRSAQPDDARIEETRMSFGDHLEELRSRLIRGLLGVLAGGIVCLIFGTDIVGILYRPLNLAQYSQGLRMELQALSPVSAFATYLKVGMLSGLLVSMPWVLYQFWQFVASGLYAHERRFVRRLMPASLGLFVIGVLFLYWVVLPLVLRFFIAFNANYSVPQMQADPDVVVEAPPIHAPVLAEDPVEPSAGDVWVNATLRRLTVKLADGLWSVPLERSADRGGVRPYFAIDQYVSFVLMLMLAFGIAFELPIVVFFLAWSGLVSTKTMSGARRYVLLGIVILAAVFTPPDVISQLMLAIPMYALFEIGLAAGRIVESRAEPAG